MNHLYRGCPSINRSYFSSKKKKEYTHTFIVGRERENELGFLVFFNFQNKKGIFFNGSSAAWELSCPFEKLQAVRACFSVQIHASFCLC